MLLPEPLTVAVIEPVGAHGGMDYYDTGLCDGLALANIKPILYTSKPILLKMNGIVDVKLFYAKVFGNSSAVLRGLLYLWATTRSLFHAKMNAARVCHLHFFHVGVLELFNVMAARLLGLKVVVTAHDVQSLTDNSSWSIFEGVTYQLAHRVIVHNRVSQLEVIRHQRVSARRVRIIKHGNYLPFLRPLPKQEVARAKLNIPSEAKVVLFLGQIKKVKGLDVLIRAFSILCKSIPESHLIIAGRPWKDEPDVYQRMIQDNGVESNTHTYFRFIPDEEIPKLFSAADLIVLPYRKIYQSGILLMSLSYGKAVLASDLEAMKEIIKDGDNGYLFLSEDVQALAKKMTKALSDESGLRLVAKRGLEFVKKEYSWEQIGRETSICYHNMVNGQ